MRLNAQFLVTWHISPHVFGRGETHKIIQEKKAQNIILNLNVKLMRRKIMRWKIHIIREWGPKESAQRIGNKSFYYSQLFFFLFPCLEPAANNKRHTRKWKRQWGNTTVEETSSSRESNKESPQQSAVKFAIKSTARRQVDLGNVRHAYHWDSIRPSERQQSLFFLLIWPPLSALSSRDMNLIESSVRKKMGIAGGRRSSVVEMGIEVKVSIEAKRSMLWW